MVDSLIHLNNAYAEAAAAMVNDKIKIAALA